MNFHRRKARKYFMPEWRQKTLTFLREEGATFRIEYAALGAIIALAILAVVTAWTKQGN
jgi:Flp pilus assembly pilin Flp